VVYYLVEHLQRCGYVLVLLFGIVFLQFLVFGVTNTYAADPTVWRVTLDDGGDVSIHETTVTTVGAFLDELGIELHPDDRLSPHHLRRIDSNIMTVRIERQFYVNLFVDGEGERVSVTPGVTVEELLIDLQLYVEDKLIFDGDKEEVLERPSILEFETTRSRVETITAEYIPYTTEYVDTRTLAIGEEAVLKEGTRGERRVEYTIVYRGNEEYSREITDEYIVPPVAQVVDRFVGPPTNPFGVELLSWSYARRNVIINGEPLLITDINTGIQFTVAAFSQGSHADVETITREDTNLIRQAFGGRWDWTPRPVWVTTVDGRVIAASMSGVPHTGTNNQDNGVIGHFCLHFYGSRVHNGNRRHERDHQNAVQEAYRTPR
jgi:hypothetical protein